MNKTKSVIAIFVMITKQKLALRKRTIGTSVFIDFFKLLCKPVKIFVIPFDYISLLNAIKQIAKGTLRICLANRFKPNLSDFLPKKLTRWAKYVI